MEIQIAKQNTMTPLFLIGDCIISTFRLCTSVSIETSAWALVQWWQWCSSFPPSPPGRKRWWMRGQSDHTVSFFDRSIPQAKHVSPGLQDGGYWWLVLWLIWADPWTQLLCKVAFHHTAFDPAWLAHWSAFSKKSEWNSLGPKTADRCIWTFQRVCPTECVWFLLGLA